GAPPPRRRGARLVPRQRRRLRAPLAAVPLRRARARDARIGRALRARRRRLALRGGADPGALDPAPRRRRWRFRDDRTARQRRLVRDKIESGAPRFRLILGLIGGMGRSFYGFV